ncbi:MAG: hypothetical protein HW389_3659 [Bacteroidetes bacterium]|nr:hypothetical protein [Bacteroidota bacterium]
MRSLSFVLVLLALFWVTGCQEKLPVELAAEQSPTALELKVLPAIDSTLIVDASVDTSGVTQQEELTYPATFLVNGVKTDLGTSKRTFSYSRMLLNDKRNPIRNLGKVIGYLGLDVGKAKVNSVDLPKTYRPFRTYTSFSPQYTAGPSYTLVDQNDQLISDFSYAAGQRYKFVADGRGTVASFELSVQSPEEITVVEPRAGSVAFRDEDLKIRWNGTAGSTFRILISSFDPQSNIPVKPLLEVTVKEGANSIVLPASVLKGLQTRSASRYLFSVISSNRIRTRVPWYSEDVLVQASSIHNVLLWLK